MRIVVGGAHSVELERTHRVQDFGALHGHALLSWSYLGQSVIGAWRNISDTGVVIGPTGGASGS